MTTRPTRLEPATLSMTGLIDAFVNIEHTMPNRTFAFILGAGASCSSRIKLGGEMVSDWLYRIYRNREDYSPPEIINSVVANEQDRKRALEWASAETLGIEGFDPKQLGASYSDIYWKMFSEHPDEGQAYLEEQIRQAELSLGYAFLAQIMDGRRHRYVITTNFDNLVVDALALFTHQYPLVCGHESLARFVHSNLRGPVVIKVHHDLRLSPKSTREDLKSLAPGFEMPLRELLHIHTPIVLGYAGNDLSLMRFLESLPDGYIPGGVYWCYRKASGIPSENIRDFVFRQRGKLVPISGFDELMMELGNRLGLKSPTETIHQRANEAAERFGRQFAQWSRSPNEPAGNSPSSHSPSSPGRDLPNTTDASRTLHALESILLRADSTSNWWEWQVKIDKHTSTEQKNAAYKEAIQVLPNSAPLLGNYASFLMAECRDFEAAGTFFQRAIDADPTNAANLGNYASFLTDIREEHEAAEAFYKRAIEADPRNAINLGNYATFLVEIRREYDAAELYYKQAIEADPSFADNLSNYADFLTNIRKEYDAAEALYRRAVDADPKNESILGHYATFLEKIRKQYDEAEVHYKRAIEIMPTKSGNLRTYAGILAHTPNKRHNAEGPSKGPAAVDPWYLDNLFRYADFLFRIRKNSRAAEELYRRAIEKSQEDADALANFSGFLLKTRRIREGLAQLEKAMAHLNPDHPCSVDAECWMYLYCCGETGNRTEALRRLKRLIVHDKIQTKDWDFSGVIDQAGKMEHPEYDWLSQLAEVLAGKTAAHSLNTWAAWNEV